MKTINCSSSFPKLYPMPMGCRAAWNIEIDGASLINSLWPQATIFSTKHIMRPKPKTLQHATGKKMGGKGTSITLPWNDRECIGWYALEDAQIPYCSDLMNKFLFDFKCSNWFDSEKSKSLQSGAKEDSMNQQDAWVHEYLVLSHISSASEEALKKKALMPIKHLLARGRGHGGSFSNAH